MNVTRVKIISPDPNSKKHLLAYAEVEFDRCFIVRDLKIIRKTDGHVFVDMPSIPSCVHCGGCGRKVPVVARYCATCGERRTDDNALPPDVPLFHNVAHPTNNQARAAIHHAVLTEYRRWRSRADDAKAREEVQHRESL